MVKESKKYRNAIRKALAIIKNDMIPLEFKSVLKYVFAYTMSENKRRKYYKLGDVYPIGFKHHLKKQYDLNEKDYETFIKFGDDPEMLIFITNKDKGTLLALSDANIQTWREDNGS